MSEDECRSRMEYRKMESRDASPYIPRRERQRNLGGGCVSFEIICVQLSFLDYLNKFIIF